MRLVFFIVAIAMVTQAVHLRRSDEMLAQTGAEADAEAEFIGKILSFLFEGRKNQPQKRFQAHDTHINIKDESKTKLAKPGKPGKPTCDCSSANPMHPIDMKKVWDFFGGQFFPQCESCDGED